MLVGEWDPPSSRLYTPSEMRRRDGWVETCCNCSPGVLGFHFGLVLRYLHVVDGIAGHRSPDSQLTRRLVSAPSDWLLFSFNKGAAGEVARDLGDRIGSGVLECGCDGDGELKITCAGLILTVLIRVCFGAEARFEGRDVTDAATAARILIPDFN